MGVHEKRPDDDVRVQEERPGDDDVRAEARREVYVAARGEGSPQQNT